jgi:hypothetical protein
MLRTYFHRKKATINVTTALVGFFAEPTIQWLTPDSPSRFSLFACAPYHQSLEDAVANDIATAKLEHKISTEADIKKLTQLRYNANLTDEHKMSKQLYNWRIGLEFRLGTNSFVCKDIRENESLLNDESEAFRAFRENVTNGALSFFYRLDFNFNQLQDDLIDFCSRENEPDIEEVSMMGLRNYLNPKTNGVFNRIRTHSQTTALINMPARIVTQFSTKQGTKRGGAGERNSNANNDRAQKKQGMGDRTNNDKINKTIKAYAFEQKSKIFAATKSGNNNCPKLGQSQLCVKYHVRGWCTNDCERKETHIVLSPETKKKFNKFCHDCQEA